MDVEYRAITDDQFEAFARVSRIAFGQEPFAPDTPFGFGRSELERTRAAFVGNEIVGSGRNYSLELTVPGGAVVPAAGVSWISVLPTHRRRGVLAGMMANLRDEAFAHRDPVSILTASEGGIYGRFGYGVATWRIGMHVERAHGAFAAPIPDDGQLRFVERDTALEEFPAVFERARRLRPGMVSRPDLWWEESFHNFAPASKANFYVVHEEPAGTIDGYMIYEIEGAFPHGINQAQLRVFDFAALTAPTRARLWQFALSVDLVAEVSTSVMAVDDPLRFLLADPRRLRVDSLNDHVWLQIVDINRALEARRYSTTDRVVLEVHDGPTVSRVALDGGPDGAQCRATTASADLVLGLAQLGSIYLGGTRAERHAAAGTIEESSPGALARVDAMFASYPVPTNTTSF